MVECRSCYRTPVFYEFIGEHHTGSECIAFFVTLTKLQGKDDHRWYKGWYALMAEQVDAGDLKSPDLWLCGFDSRSEH